MGPTCLATDLCAAIDSAGRCGIDEVFIISEVKKLIFKTFHNTYNNIFLSESREILRVIEDICKRYQREWIDYFLTSMIMSVAMPKASLRVISSFINVRHYF